MTLTERIDQLIRENEELIKALDKLQEELNSLGAKNVV